MAVLAGENFGDRKAFVLGLVGEHRPAHDIADGVNARNIGGEMIVDDDAAALGRDADFFKAKAVGDRTPADGDENDVGLKR